MLRTCSTITAQASAVKKQASNDIPGTISGLRLPPTSSNWFYPSVARSVRFFFFGLGSEALCIASKTRNATPTSESLGPQAMQQPQHWHPSKGLWLRQGWLPHPYHWLFWTPWHGPPPARISPQPSHSLSLRAPQGHWH